MPLDSQLDSREEFFARVYKAPVEEKPEVIEQEIKPSDYLGTALTGSIFGISSFASTYGVLFDKALDFSESTRYALASTILGMGLAWFYVAYQEYLNYIRFNQGSNQ